MAANVEKNVTVGRGGSKALDLSTLRGYLKFAQDLPSGHIFQAKIQGLYGQAELYTDPSNIGTAVNDFLHPDVSAPAKARDVTLGIKRRANVLRPAQVTVSVLNGNGVQGSAANAAYALGQRGYKIVLPPSQRPGNAPNFNYFNTTVYYDTLQRGSKAGAGQLANLFGDADVKPMTAQITSLATGAMTAVVVGQNFHGSIAPAPIDHTPKAQPPAVTPGTAATLPLLRGVVHRVRFRLELPHVLARGSEPEPLAPIRVYRVVKGHVGVRLTFEQTPTDFWGIEETDWNEAPVLASPSFEHRLGGRVFDFYYSGSHLHMVVLKENGASYWVINTILDSLSNETMLAIAKGLHPLS